MASSSKRSARSSARSQGPARAGAVAIIGAPNAGKSTLLNRLVGEKLAIVTPKVQTTRTRVRGVCTEGNSQLVLIDTPGIFRAKQGFETRLVEEAWAGAAEADVLLLLLDAGKGLTEEVQALIPKLPRKVPLLLALNKIDTVKKPWLLSLASACAAYGVFDAVFMIAAATGDGVIDLKRELAQRVPEGAWPYPADHLTDTPLRELAAEYTREALFMLLRQELPYSLKVETEQWAETASGVRIHQSIVVERESQKKIVLGAGGEGIKTVGTRARKALETLLSKPVRLELFVKVDADWKARG